MKPLDQYSPEQQRIILEKFASLADAQKGQPEMLGTMPSANPALFNAQGVYTWLTEHIGDLTQRMSQRHCERMDFGWEFINEKLSKTVRLFGYGIEREVAESLRKNYNYKIGSQTFEDFTEEFRQAAAKYAKAHSKLVVWNECQWLARDAAISLGRLRYDIFQNNVLELKKRIDQGREEWSSLAGQASISNGRLEPYQIPMI